MATVDGEHVLHLLFLQNAPDERTTINTSHWQILLWGFRRGIFPYFFCPRQGKNNKKGRPSRASLSFGNRVTWYVLHTLLQYHVPRVTCLQNKVLQPNPRRVT